MKTLDTGNLFAGEYQITSATTYTSFDDALETDLLDPNPDWLDNFDFTNNRLLLVQEYKIHDVENSHFVWRDTWATLPNGSNVATVLEIGDFN